MSEPESPAERSRRLPSRPPSPTGTAAQHPVTAAGQAPASSTSEHVAASPETGAAPSPAAPSAAPTGDRVPPWFALSDEPAPAPDPISDSQLALPLPVAEHQVPDSAHAQPDDHPAHPHDSAHAPAADHSARDHGTEHHAQSPEPAQAYVAAPQPHQPAPARPADSTAQPHSTPSQEQSQPAASESTPQPDQPPAAAQPYSSAEPSQAPATVRPAETSTTVHRTDQLARPSAPQYAPNQPEPTQAYPQPSRPDQPTQHQPPRPQSDQRTRPAVAPEAAPTQFQPQAYGHTGQQPPAPAYGHTGPQSPAYGYPNQQPGYGQTGQQPAYGRTGSQPPQPVYGHTGPQAPYPGPTPPLQPTLQNQEPVGLDHLMGMPGDERTERARPPRGPRPPRDPRPPRAAGPPKSNKGLVFALQILGLILVALLAGTLWVACSPSGHSQKSPTSAPTASGPTSGPPTAGGYTFQQVAQQSDPACQPNAYGKAADYFAQHPCQALTRWLFTTTSQSGEKVVTALAKVQMPDAESAAGLDALVKQDGTGSVGYLTHPGFAVPAGPTRMGKDAGFSSMANDTVVLIAESAFLETDAKDEAQLKQISAAALTSQGK